jgi:phosphoglycolate phosphatase
MKYKLVIFDFDGTLADSFPWFIHRVNSVATKYRFKQIEEAEIEKLRGYGARQVVKHLGIPWWKIPLIANHMRRMVAQATGEILPFPGVDQLLNRLSEAGLTLALVTSNSRANVRQVLGEENFALLRYVECDVSLFGKRARFRKILKQSGVRSGEAICIGDEIRDLEAANQEHIAFGAVAWGFTNVDAFHAHAPTELFMQIDDIIEKLVNS